MTKIESTRSNNPDSYDIWDAGAVSYIMNSRYSPQLRKSLPLVPNRVTDITRTDQRWFQHVNYSMMALELILSGGVEYRTERKTCIAGPGMLYVVAKGSNVRMVKSGDRQRRKLTILISGSCLDSIADSLGFGTDRLLNLSAPEKTEAMMREIQRGIAEGKSPEYLSSKCYELLLHLSAELPQGPDDLRPALEWIAEKPEYKTSIPELAEKCGLSESTFRRKFTAVFGMSPARYLLRRRLTLSKEWLNGKTSIKEISARCGFSSPLRFALAFKNCFGETPSSFRMKKQLKNER